METNVIAWSDGKFFGGKCVDFKAFGRPTSKITREKQISKGEISGIDFDILCKHRYCALRIVTSEPFA